MTSRARKLLAAVLRQRELVLPVLVAAILGALVVPLPVWLLDIGLALNLLAAAALLIAALRAANMTRRATSCSWIVRRVWGLT